jgi:hypothetical protein
MFGRQKIKWQVRMASVAMIPKQRNYGCQVKTLVATTTTPVN